MSSIRSVEERARSAARGLCAAGSGMLAHTAPVPGAWGKHGALSDSEPTSAHWTSCQYVLRMLAIIEAADECFTVAAIG
jgi:hypothetical protein